MDHGGEAIVRLFVARGDAAEILDLLEEILDEVTPLIHLLIMWDGRFAIGLRGNDRNRAAHIEPGAQTVAVERLVRDERVKVDALDERLDPNAVMALTRQEDEACKVPERVDKRNDLGRQPATRASYGLIESPPFAPVPCRCTFTIVPSIRAYSKSGSPANALKRLSHLPLSAQR